ncbi:MAG: hypothetical protein V4591_10255 [Bdellovibrionota bacterium]
MNTILDFLITLLVASVFVVFISMFYLVFFVRKDIEKRYKTEIQFPAYFRAVFLGKYASMAAIIIRIYLTEKMIIKKSKYYDDIYLIKMNYTTRSEKKANIFICFLLGISLFLMCISAFLLIYVGNKVYI